MTFYTTRFVLKHVRAIQSSKLFISVVNMWLNRGPLLVLNIIRILTLLDSWNQRQSDNLTSHVTRSNAFPFSFYDTKIWAPTLPVSSFHLFSSYANIRIVWFSNVNLPLISSQIIVAYSTISRKFFVHNQTFLIKKICYWGVVLPHKYVRLFDYILCFNGWS